MKPSQYTLRIIHPWPRSDRDRAELDIIRMYRDGMYHAIADFCRERIEETNNLEEQIFFCDWAHTCAGHMGDDDMIWHWGDLFNTKSEMLKELLAAYGRGGAW